MARLQVHPKYTELFFLTEIVGCFFSAGFKRPVVIFGPISDAVNEKLATDMPNEFVVASKRSHQVLSKLHEACGEHND